MTSIKRLEFFFGFWILLSKFIEKEINKKSNVKKHVPHVACITNIMLIFKIHNNTLANGGFFSILEYKQMNFEREL